MARGGHRLLLRRLNATSFALAAAALLLLCTAPPTVTTWSIWPGGSGGSASQPGADESAEQSNNSNSQQGNNDSNSVTPTEQPPPMGVPRYQPEQQYNYKYDSQMASSLTGAEQFSVARMRAQVKLQFLPVPALPPKDHSKQGDRVAVVQCEQVQLAIAQHPLNMEPNRHQRMMDIDDLDAIAVSEKTQKTLQMPFQITLSKNGRVKEIRFQQKDQAWSENIKRSMMNLIQSQAPKRGYYSSPYSSSQQGAGSQQSNQTMDYYNNYDSEVSSNPNTPSGLISYKRMESTIEGKCEVVYTIIPQQKQQQRQLRRQQRQQEDSSENTNQQQQDNDDSNSAPNSAPVKVVKSVNMAKCANRPELRYNFYRHSEDFSASNAIASGHSPVEEEAVDVSTVYELKVGQPAEQLISASAKANSGDDEAQPNPVVLRSQATSQITSDLLDSDRPAMVTYAKAQLELTSVDGKASSEQWSSPADLKPKHSGEGLQAPPLIYSLAADILHERFIAEGDEEYLKPTSSAYPSTENLPAIAVNVMKELMASAKVGTGKGGKGGKFIELGEEATRHLEHFINVIRLCNKKQIGEIRKQLGPLVSGNGDQGWKVSKFLRDIFSDALTSACTQPSIAEFIEIISGEQISYSKAARAITQLAQCRVVSPTQLEQVWSICEGSAAKSYQPLRRTCILTWSSMAGTMCSASDAMNETSAWAAIQQQKQQQQQQQDLSTAPDEEQATLHPLGGHSDSDKWAGYVGDTSSKQQSHAPTGRQCTVEQSKEYAAKLQSLYDNAASNNADQPAAEKIAAIKAMGNAGLAPSLEFLLRVAQSTEESQLVRAQAVDAMRHIVHLAPKSVQHALLQIFQDRAEPELVRLSAFYQMLHSQPDTATMDIVCATVQQETNQHVQAFVQTAIRKMADSRRHFDQKTAKVLNAALAKLKAWNAYDESAEQRSGSQLNQFAFFSGDYTHTKPSRGTGQAEFGMGLTMTKIYGKDSAILPKEVSAAVDVLFDGRLMGDVFQLSFQQQNAERAFQRMAEHIGAKNIDQVIVRSRRSSGASAGGKSNSNSFNPFAAMKRFIAKLSPFGSSSSSSDSSNLPENEQPQVLISVRANGNDMDFVLVDEKYVMDRFVRNGRIDLSRLESSKNTTDQQFHHYAATLGAGYKIKVPTVAGIPIVVSASTPALAACEGQAKLEFEPFGSDKMRGLRVFTNMQAQSAVTLVRNMEVFSPLFTSGVNTHHFMAFKLPLNLQLKVSSAASNFGKQQESSSSNSPAIPTVELEWRLPQREDLLLKRVSSRPSTYQRVWPASGTFDSDKYIARREHTLYVPALEEDQREMRVRRRCPLTGLMWEASGHGGMPSQGSNARRCASAHVSAMLAGENHAELRGLPSQSPLAAEKIRIRIQFQQAVIDGEMDKSRLLKLFNAYPELFIDSAPQEVQLVKQFIQQFQPRMSIATKLRVTAETEQSPQKRIGRFELSSYCDQRHFICSTTTKAEWKRDAADTSEIPQQQHSPSTTAMIEAEQASAQGPYSLTVQSNSQIACPVLQGVYSGGIRSQHMLAKVDTKVSGSEFGNNDDDSEQQKQGTISASVYAKPSANRVMDWQMLLEEARQVGVIMAGGVRTSGGGIPTVLKANDAAAVLEFQSATPSKKLLREGYYQAKNFVPQALINIQADWEDKLWSNNDVQQQQQDGKKLKLYTRIILDDIIVDGKPTISLNFTLSDDAFALQKMRSQMAITGEEPTNHKGNHIQANSPQQPKQLGSMESSSEEENGMASSSGRQMNKQQRARALATSEQTSFIPDIFSPASSSSPSGVTHASSSEYSSSRGSYAQCQIDQARYVQSFDGQHYVIPLLSSCYTVLAKDCSHNGVGKNGKKQPPAFTVLAKKENAHGSAANKNGQQQQEERLHVKVKLETPERREYEFYLAAPMSQHKHTGKAAGAQNQLPSSPRMIIKRNGEELSEEDYQQEGISVIDPSAPGAAKLPLTQQQRGKGEKKNPSSSWQQPPTYVLHCPTTGAELVFNGWQLAVRLDSRHANKQCGICGHYNMDSADELMTMIDGPMSKSSGGGKGKGSSGKQLAGSLRAFHQSYVDAEESQQQSGNSGVCDPQKIAEQIRANQGGAGAQRQQQQKGNKKNGGRNEEENDHSNDNDSYTYKKAEKRNRQWGWGQQSSSSQQDDEQQQQQLQSGKQQPSNNNEEEFFGDQAEIDSLNAKSNEEGSEDEADTEGMLPPASSSSEKGGRYNRYSSSSSKKLSPRSSTRVQEFASEVCFSRRPVPTCPPGSRYHQSAAKKEKVAFMCLPRHTAEAARWMAQLRRAEKQGRLTTIDLVGALRQQPGNRFDGQRAFTKMMWQPEECVKVQQQQQQAYGDDAGYGSSSSEEGRRD